MKKALKVLSTVMAAGMLAACGSTAASSTATSATSTAESTVASSDEAVTLRLGHTQPTDHQVNITAERFAELVNEYSGGSVTVEVYPNSTFGSASEMNAAVQSGDPGPVCERFCSVRIPVRADDRCGRLVYV